MGRLTADQKKFYKDNGYILLKNIIPDDLLDKVENEYDKLFKRKNQEVMENSWVGSDSNNRQVDKNPYTVKGIHNLQHHHAIFGRVLLHEPLLDALRDVMGTDNIMLHHTKAHYKPPEKGAAYPMHQDYPYFPYERDSLVAAFIHLDAAGPDNGGLFVYPGSHRLGPLEDVGKNEGNFHYVDQKKFPFEKATPVIASRGDVVIFSYLLVHGSTPNSSSRPRRMLLLQLADPEDVPLGDQRQQPGYGWMLSGANMKKDAAISNRHEYK